MIGNYHEPEPGMPTMELLETCDGPGGPPIGRWWLTNGTIPAAILAACVGAILGLTILDLTLAAALMVRLLKELTP